MTDIPNLGHFIILNFEKSVMSLLLYLDYKGRTHKSDIQKEENFSKGVR